MPTLPSEAHQHREVAESFGADAARYDRTRPHYPAALIDHIMTIARGPEILDVGIGTGIAARQFRAAGGRVSGVEPDPRMADFARRDGFPVDVSTFETWDPAGRTFDAVVSAQAWHWVDPAAGAAKAARVLRAGGVFAVFWNGAQPSPAAAEAFGAVYRRVVPDSLTARAYRKPAPRDRAAEAGPAPDRAAGRGDRAGPGYSPLATKAADGIRAAGRFGEPELWQADWELRYTRDEWLDLAPTQGDHSRFAPAESAAVLDGMGAAIDAMGGSFAMTYTTVALLAVNC